MVFNLETGGFAEQAIVLSFGSRCVDRQTWGGHVRTLNKHIIYLGTSQLLTIVHTFPRLIRKS